MKLRAKRVSKVAYIWRGTLSTNQMVTVMLKKHPGYRREVLWTDPPFAKLMADEQQELLEISTQTIMTNLGLVRRGRTPKECPIEGFLSTLDEVRAALRGDGVVSKESGEQQGTLTSLTDSRLVAQEEFKEFLTSYPRTLTIHFLTVGDPPILQYCDETRGQYPGTVVASVTKEWDAKWHNTIESDWRIFVSEKEVPYG